MNQSSAFLHVFFGELEERKSQARHKPSGQYRAVKVMSKVWVARESFPLWSGLASWKICGFVMVCDGLVGILASDKEDLQSFDWQRYIYIYSGQSWLLIGRNGRKKGYSDKCKSHILEQSYRTSVIEQQRCDLHQERLFQQEQRLQRVGDLRRTGRRGVGTGQIWVGEIRNPGADWSFTLFTTLMRHGDIRLIYSRIANRIHARHTQTRQSLVDI